MKSNGDSDDKDSLHIMEHEIKNRINPPKCHTRIQCIIGLQPTKSMTIIRSFYPVE